MLVTVLRTLTRSTSLLTSEFSPLVTVSRGRRLWHRPYFISLYKRRQDQGPEPERPRSVWRNWNYDAEIYAFGKRLGEEFKTAILKQAFVTKSFLEKEMIKRSELSIEEESAQLDVEDNQVLAEKGWSTAVQYIQRYLRHSYPLLPEDGIVSITDHLLSVDTLSYIASNFGIKDLIQTAEFPASNETLSNVFIAVIGALHQSQGQERAELFVLDFILPQLIGKDILELCNINNPMGLLTDMLHQQGRPEPEPRLLWSTGSETILASYIVGVYCDRQLIGQAPGETVSIAEEMAARDALRRLLHIRDNRPPLPFGQAGRNLKLSSAERTL